MQISNSVNSITVTCPGCGLLCDDVLVNQQTLAVEKNGCEKSVKFFTQAIAKTPSSFDVPTLLGVPTDLKTAIKAAATIINSSQQPLFAGLGTEVKGMRSLMRLAEKANATLDHMHSESSVKNTLALQNGGYQTTTMTEVKNRADVIVIIGTDIVSSQPRFFEKLVWNDQSLFNKPTPEIIYLGIPESIPAKNLEAAISPTGQQPTVVRAETNTLPEIINALNALLNAKNPLSKQADTDQIANIPLVTLKNVVEKLKAAQYGVVVWSASSLKIPHGELTVQSIIQFINTLNETNRVAGLPLNSGDGDTSVNNTSAWMSGYPTRNRFNHGHARYDAHQFSTKKQLDQCDSLLWVSTFNPVAPPQTTAPTIAIGHPNMIFETKPDVFIPVAIPGIHQTGNMFRLDSSVTLPLAKVTDSTLPTLSAVIEQIEGLLA